MQTASGKPRRGRETAAQIIHHVGGAARGPHPGARSLRPQAAGLRGNSGERAARSANYRKAA